MPDVILTVRGGDWSAPVKQPKTEWYTDINGDRIVVYYRDKMSGWKTRLPTLFAPYPDYPLALYANANARQINNSIFCEVQVNFLQTSAGVGDDTPPTDVAESGSNIKESIKYHSNFKSASGAGSPPDANSPWSQYWDSNLNAFRPVPSIPFVNTPDYLIPITDFDVGASTITVTDYFTGEPDDVQPLLGTIGTPPGRSATAGHYLIITGNKNQRGKWWVRVLVYQYSGLVVPTQVYPPVPE